jgi:hypothetical protein
MFAMSAENFRSFRGDNANNLDFDHPQGIKLWDSDRCAHCKVSMKTCT